MANSNSKDGSDLEDFGIEYASAIESTSLVTIKDKYGLFIDGEFVSSSSGKSFETLDPSTENSLSVVTEASSALAVLPETPLSLISITAEPSGLILLVT